MQVKLDDEVLFEIDERMVKLLAHDLLDPIAEIKRRLRYIIEHKCDQTFDRMHKEYKDKLDQDPDVKMLPKGKAEMCDLIMSRPYYCNRADRESK